MTYELWKCLLFVGGTLVLLSRADSLLCADKNRF